MAYRKRPRTHASPYLHTLYLAHTYTHMPHTHTHTRPYTNKKGNKSYVSVCLELANTIFSAATTAGGAAGSYFRGSYHGRWRQRHRERERCRRWCGYWKYKKNILGQIHYYANWIRECTHARRTSRETHMATRARRFRFHLGAIKTRVAREREKKLCMYNVAMNKWEKKKKKKFANATYSSVAMRACMGASELPCFSLFLSFFILRCCCLFVHFSRLFCVLRAVVRCVYVPSLFHARHKRKKLNLVYYFVETRTRRSTELPNTNLITHSVENVTPLWHGQHNTLHVYNFIHIHECYEIYRKTFDGSPCAECQQEEEGDQSEKSWKAEEWTKAALKVLITTKRLAHTLSQTLTLTDRIIIVIISSCGEFFFAFFSPIKFKAHSEHVSNKQKLLC